MKLRPAVVVAALMAATALATSPALPSGAAATHPSTTVPTPGPGWLLDVWYPHPATSEVSHVELVSPQGHRYILFRNPGGQVADWSGDGTRLLVTGVSGRSNVLRVLDLATGDVEDTIKVGGFKLNGDDGVTATFTRPDGLAVYSYVNGTRQGLIRYSLTGAVEASFPAAVAGLGRWTDSWLESPDGLYLVLGTDRGLALFSNDGTLLARMPSKETDCVPVRWWSASVVLAACHSIPGVEDFQLLEFSATWATPRPLGKEQRDSAGYADAYRVDGHVFLQGAGDCGLAPLAELRGSTPVKVDVPVKGNAGDLDRVVTTTSTSLALAISDGCDAQPSVYWYTPATNSVLQVLGPPVSGGNVVNIIGYPDPNSTGATGY